MEVRTKASDVKNATDAEATFAVPFVKAIERFMNRVKEADDDED